MKIICSQKSLFNGIQIVQKAISTKIGLPIYNGTLFEITPDNKIHLFSTDLEIGIDCYIPAQIIERGSVVVPNKILSDLIRKFPDGNIEIESGENHMIQIKEEDSSEYRILGFSSDEFPTFPDIQTKAKINISQKLLKDSIQEVLFSSSKDENRSFLNGVLFKSFEKNIEIAATDSHRLALKKIKLNHPNKISINSQFEIIIPQRTLSELSKLLLSDESSMIEIGIGENQVIFTLISNGENYQVRLYSRIIEGQFPDYHQIIPTHFKTAVKIDTEEFKQRMDRITLFVKEDLNTIKMEVYQFNQNSENKKGEMIIRVKTPDIGEACEKIPCEIEGEYIEISFNSHYIIDVLKIIKSDFTELKLNENLSPVMIKPVEKEDTYNYILMPVRMD